METMQQRTEQNWRPMVLQESLEAAELKVRRLFVLWRFCGGSVESRVLVLVLQERRPPAAAGSSEADDGSH